MADAKPPQQIPFDLSPERAMSFDNFLKCDGTGLVVEQLKDWKNWSSPLLLLIGEAGVGKTHLGTAFAAQSAKVHFIDNANDVPEVKLFSEMNRALTGEVGAMVLAAPTHPLEWDVQMPDLRSRLNNTPVAKLLPPDDDVLEGITRQSFEGFGRLVSKDLVTYIVSRTARTVPALQALVRQLELQAQSDKSDMTKAYVSRHISRWSEPELF